ncbi:fimbrial protein [Photorhabdus sp. CRCIA-P01]|uniref:fimbrial protein n=1 Tax=Photorhabdus sp. CRCIA-P01 TaxID=2019570 RepID=UPI000E59A08E|nr:fimbrial protein [Photorhabdus sp. CRCIA-P01]
MKLNTLVIALGLGVTLTAGSVNAQTKPPASTKNTNQGQGKVTFEGSIIDAPCSIHPGDDDQTVKLGQISNKALAGGGKSTPVPFNIRLLDCDANGLEKKIVTATFSGTPSSVNKDLLAIVGSASGAAIGITNDNAKLIKLGQQSSPTIITDGSDSTMHFAAFLQGDGASATIVPGDFTAVANFTLAYQ